MNILIVEDDNKFARKCAEKIIKFGHDLFYALNADQAKIKLMEIEFDFIIIDLMLPPTFTREGVDLLKFVRAHHPNIIPFMMTIKQNKMTELVAESMKVGAEYFLDKKSVNFFDKLESEFKRKVKEMKKGIFISHGHNDILKLKLKEFIRDRMKRIPIILSEQPNNGMTTVVEKLEKISEKCDFAIILLTNDDKMKSGGMRARQNVIHEIGFFQGKYGRHRVILLAEQGVELFSNISGIIRIEFTKGHFEEIYEPLRIELESLD